MRINFAVVFVFNSRRCFAHFVFSFLDVEISQKILNKTSTLFATIAIFNQMLVNTKEFIKDNVTRVNIHILFFCILNPPLIVDIIYLRTTPKGEEVFRPPWL